MFEKIVSTPVRTRTVKTVEIPQTEEFLTCVRDNGYRLSYAALALVARELGEDSSTQIAAQRGAKLVLSMPVSLQPFVCRKSGGYAKAVLARFTDLPEDLLDRSVITASAVGDAVAEFRASLG